MDFKSLLKEAGLTKTAFAKLLGMNPNSVSNWKDNPPIYAMAYLELLIKYNSIKTT